MLGDSLDDAVVDRMLKCVAVEIAISIKAILCSTDLISQNYINTYNGLII